MEVRLTTLSENTATYGFLGEWGLSILVEADGMRVLVDTGLGASAVHNAQLLGIDLSTVDMIVLSHGHADHTGGLQEVLRRTGPVKVIAHPDTWGLKYARGERGQARYIGVPFSRAELESWGGDFNLTEEPVRISPRMMTTGVIPLSTSYEQVDANLYVKEGAHFAPDPLADDLSLIIETDFGLVVILGCAHRGIVNTLEHARRLTGEETIYAAVGGSHLFRASPQRIEETATALKQMGVQLLGVSHCTGFAASTRLAHELGSALVANNAGTRLKLP